MTSIEIKKDETREFNTVVLLIDGFEKGFFTVASEGLYAFRVENVNIDTDLRGKGFYKMLITAAFNIFNIDTLRSSSRNHNSNPVYEYWCGQELANDDTVFIQLENETLVFTVDTYVED